MRTFLCALASILLFALGCSSQDESKGTEQALVGGELSIGQWNLEWFGATGSTGRTPEQHLASVTKGIERANVDVWALEEVVDPALFVRLRDGLQDYDGIVANDPTVTGGSKYYSGGEQKPAVLFRRSMAKLVESKIVLPEEDAAFAGRPPLLVRLRLYDGGDLVVIVVHLKAGGGAGAWEARRHSTTKLKTWLDANLPTDRVLVLGDFNDDVTTSIFRSKPSPFSAFLEDPAHYRFVTRSLSEEGVSSTVNHAGLIDHQIASDELMDKLVPGSVEVLRLDRTLPSYRRSTSDHLPVTARYRIANDAP